MRLIEIVHLWILPNTWECFLKLIKCISLEFISWVCLYMPPYNCAIYSLFETTYAYVCSLRIKLSNVTCMKLQGAWLWILTFAKLPNPLTDFDVWKNNFTLTEIIFHWPFVQCKWFIHASWWKNRLHLLYLEYIWTTCASPKGSKVMTPWPAKPQILTVLVKQNR